MKSSIKISQPKQPSIIFPLSKDYLWCHWQCDNVLLRLLFKIIKSKEQKCYKHLLNANSRTYFLNLFILGLQHLRSHRYYLLADVYFFSRFLLSFWNSCSGKLKAKRTSPNQSLDRYVYYFFRLWFKPHEILKSCLSAHTLVTLDNILPSKSVNPNQRHGSISSRITKSCGSCGHKRYSHSSELQDQFHQQQRSQTGPKILIISQNYHQVISMSNNWSIFTDFRIKIHF